MQQRKCLWNTGAGETRSLRDLAAPLFFPPEKDLTQQLRLPRDSGCVFKKQEVRTSYLGSNRTAETLQKSYGLCPVLAPIPQNSWAVSPKHCWLAQTLAWKTSASKGKRGESSNLIHGTEHLCSLNVTINSINVINPQESEEEGSKFWR